jgi:hypothetical protein
MTTSDSVRPLTAAGQELLDDLRRVAQPGLPRSLREEPLNTIRAIEEEAAALRETLLNIGADHEGCTLSVDRVDADDYGYRGHWLLVCEVHDEAEPLLDFEELERAALREAQP